MDQHRSARRQPGDDGSGTMSGDKRSGADTLTHDRGLGGRSVPPEGSVAVRRRSPNGAAARVHEPVQNNPSGNGVQLVAKQVLTASQ